MSGTESSLSRFAANAAEVQSHEVGLKAKGLTIPTVTKANNAELAQLVEQLIRNE